MKLIAVLLIISFFSCDQSYSSKHTRQIETKEADVEGVVVIDSCEYIKFETYMNYGYTHKGNCKFCMKRIYNK